MALSMLVIIIIYVLRKGGLLKKVLRLLRVKRLVEGAVRSAHDVLFEVLLLFYNMILSVVGLQNYMIIFLF